jgi:hypothetical protein
MFCWKTHQLNLSFRFYEKPVVLALCNAIFFFTTMKYQTELDPKQALNFKMDMKTS